MDSKLAEFIRKLYGIVESGAEAYGSANRPMSPEHSGMLGGLLMDMTPGVGDVKSAYDGVQAAKQGDWLGAGLGGLGALPMVPNLAGAISTKITRKAAEELAGKDPRLENIRTALNELSEREQSLWNKYGSPSPGKANLWSGGRLEAMNQQENIRQSILGSDEYLDIQNSKNS